MTVIQCEDTNNMGKTLALLQTLKHIHSIVLLDHSEKTGISSYSGTYLDDIACAGVY
jgi:hypothetical protein